MRKGDRGTTMLELMVAAGLIVLAAGSILAVYDSTMRADRSQESAVVVRQSLRRGVTEMSRDIRAGTVLAPTTSAAAATTLDLTVPTGGGASQTVRYRLDVPTARVLRETLSGPGGSVTATRVVLSNASYTGGTTLFRYFAPSAAEQVAGVASVANLVTCTTRIRVTLSATPGTGRPAEQATTDLALRNKSAEGLAC